MLGTPDAAIEVGIAAIVDLRAAGVAAFIPSLSDYKDASQDWIEAEYRCLTQQCDNVVAGFWTGEPGRVSFDAWPYTEICSILSGRVGVRDLAGRQREFGAGEAFIIPKGWAGDWLTLQTSAKIFVAIS